MRFQGFLLIIGGIGDKRGMEIPETRSFRRGAYRRAEGAACIAAARIGPGGEQRCGNIALLAGAALREIGAARRRTALLDRLDAKGEAREAIVGSCTIRRIGEAESVLHIAFETAAMKARSIRFGLRGSNRSASRKKVAAATVMCSAPAIGPRDNCGWAFANLERCCNGQVSCVRACALSRAAGTTNAPRQSAASRARRGGSGCHKLCG